VDARIDERWDVINDASVALLATPAPSMRRMSSGCAPWGLFAIEVPAAHRGGEPLGNGLKDSTLTLGYQ
jgi:hypothetical protein